MRPDRLEIAAVVALMVLQEPLLGRVLDAAGIASLVDQVLMPLIGGPEWAVRECLSDSVIARWCGSGADSSGLGSGGFPRSGVCGLVGWPGE